MKYFLYILLFNFAICKSYAQEKHFIFIQSEIRQPFYVSLNGKIYSSTATGYTIIPKLVDSTYVFRIGFAQNGAEYPFAYTITNKDAGFSLKNFGEKGWGLFNLQTFNVIMAGERTPNSAQIGVKEVRAEISFDVKKDPATNKNVQTIVAITGIDSSKAADTFAVAKYSSASNARGADTTRISANAQVRKHDTSGVSKVSQVENAEGVSLKYVDKNGRATDTIDIKIMKSGTPIINSAEIGQNAVSNNPALSGTNISIRVDTFSAVNSDTNKKASSQASTSCKELATDEDYTRLRRKMAHETTDETMLNEAKKMYRRKCFSTSQLRMLSTLFLSDEGRYLFFFESYPFVSDPEQFISLQKEFIDPAYVAKFQAQYKQVN